MKADPDSPVVLTTANTDSEAGLVASTLREHGIDARVIDAVGSTLAIFGPALNQPIQIVVRRADAERAAAILCNVRQESVDIDWSEVDVGVMSDPSPPRFSRRARDRSLVTVLFVLITVFLLIFAGLSI